MTYHAKFPTIMLSPEVRAIVRATAPAILASKAAIRFRMWHHLRDERSRRGLFEEFIAGDQAVGLIEALVECGQERAPHDRPSLARRVAAAEQTWLHDTLKPALRKAMREVLGAGATDTVLNAWASTFSYLLAPAA